MRTTLTRRATRLFLGVVLAGMYSPAWAVLVAYDGFDYPDTSTLDGATGGSGWTGDWTTPSVSATVVSPGLQGAGLEVEGNAVSSNSNGGGSTINFRSAGTFDSGEVWISFLAQAEEASALEQFFGYTFYRGGEATANQVATIQKMPSTSLWGVTQNSAGGSGGANTSSEMLTAGVTDLLVGQVVFDEAGDTLNLFVNPDIRAAAPIIPNATITGGDYSFDGIRIASAQGLTWLYDELRVGDTFVDVTPAIPISTDFVAPAGTGIEDFDVLRDNYLTGTLFEQGDANLDGIVNHEDFYLWRTDYLAEGGVASAISWSPVPEPATAFLLLTAPLFVFTRKRRR